MNDPEIYYKNTQALFKYADDSTIVSPVYTGSDPSVSLVEQFLTSTKENKMSCNPSKCTELIVRKKLTTATTYEPVNIILQYNNLPLHLVTLQSDCKFHSHVRQKLVKAKRCLHVL